MRPASRAKLTAERAKIAATGHATTARTATAGAGDCGECPTSCGDGTCNGDETCESCGSDCGACEYCGDGSCNNGEDCKQLRWRTAVSARRPAVTGRAMRARTAMAVPSDCGACEYCGDGSCNNGEDCNGCPSDCGACEYCGDGSWQQRGRLRQLFARLRRVPVDLR